MVNWSKLARLVVEAEFPSFGALIALGSITTLSETTVPVKILQLSCEKMASLFKLDMESLLQLI
jgi:hypothetical protein